MEYMANRLGAWQVGNDQERGKVDFKIFFPDGWDPEITSIRVAGDFQKQISDIKDWNFEEGLSMNKNKINEGTI